MKLRNPLALAVMSWATLGELLTSRCSCKDAKKVWQAFATLLWPLPVGAYSASVLIACQIARQLVLELIHEIGFGACDVLVCQKYRLACVASAYRLGNRLVLIPNG